MSDKDMALPSDRAASPSGLSPSGSSQSGIPSAWAFAYEAPAGARILGRDFFGINVGWADAQSDADVMWFCDDGRWRTYSDRDRDGYSGGCSSAAPCRSFKAFRSHLRRHPELRGRRARLVSRWVGFDVWAVPASGIEARSDATGTGAAEGESPTGKAGDAL